MIQATFKRLLAIAYILVMPMNGLDEVLEDLRGCNEFYRWKPSQDSGPQKMMGTLGKIVSISERPDLVISGTENSCDNTASISD